jgi:hypothetical protein
MEVVEPTRNHDWHATSRNQKRADLSFRVDCDDHARARWAASPEHGSRCQPRDVEVPIRCVVVDCVVIDVHDFEALSRSGHKRWAASSPRERGRVLH